MSSFNIENLISLLEKGKISKDELMSAMDQIKFQPAGSDTAAAEQTHEKSGGNTPEDIHAESCKPYVPSEPEEDKKLQGRARIRSIV